ncbi:PBSX family phage terminase large subunit [Clostridium botulinum]|uniref:PBSX family phage terminase large subunit n=1 Tax=unclassified Clostridium TaxID=2614128 RepID=UPI0005412CA5|nr:MULTISPECIES: PBSX family phage terminase large subunit [unclassified Clostridium]AIY81615.1 phage terminase, large subunit, PBSX family [Clostridium botulinum 202F]KAI3345007.1 PBSX family phage terminase large subunit [Clostridium botulinum]KON14092.1 PBSX family phage terminase, large subunit [Clostridium botulinum]MBY6986424.1 PBSX family phage terminase large subunit [Clostridium botulinum]MBY7009068.1 PBSX family phage terminase large subunit [Clostridium botulinum]
MKFTISKKMFNETYLSQLENYDTRFNVYYGGAGSGKSVFVFQKMVLKMLKYSDRKCLVVRKINNTLKDSCFALVKSILSDWHLYEQCKINKTDLTIELPNGSLFLFKGLDDPERIKSINGIDDIIVEECTEIDDFTFDQLCLRLRSKKPYNQVHVMFNPVSKSNWVFSRWFNPMDSMDRTDLKNTMVLKTTYLDNKFLPQDYIDNLLEMKKTNPVYYRIYALGEFATLSKLIYTNWEVQEFDYRQILKEKYDRQAVFNVDFGYTNDPTAFGAEVLDEVDKIIWIFDEFQEKGLLNDEIANKITDLGYRKEVIVCDSAEPKSIDELKRNGINRAVPSIKGRDSIINGIQLLQQYKIIVHPKCKYIQEELKNYCWKKDRDGKYINTPIDKFNHGLDSLRYGITHAIQNKKASFSIIYR